MAPGEPCSASKASSAATPPPATITRGRGFPWGISDLLRFHLDHAARALLRADPAALAVIELDRVGVEPSSCLSMDALRVGVAERVREAGPDRRRERLGQRRSPSQRRARPAAARPAAGGPKLRTELTRTYPFERRPLNASTWCSSVGSGPRSAQAPSARISRPHAAAIAPPHTSGTSARAPASSPSASCTDGGSPSMLCGLAATDAADTVSWQFLLSSKDLVRTCHAPNRNGRGAGPPPQVLRVTGQSRATRAIASDATTRTRTLLALVDLVVASVRAQ